MKSIFKALCLLFFSHSLLAQCNIGPLQLNNQACDANGMYMIELDFTYTNVGNQGFVVYSSYTMADTFQYADLPVMVGPIPGYCNQGMDFWVEDIEIGGQCSDIVIPYLQCCINSGGISNITIDTICDNNGKFDLVVDFDQGPGLGSNFNVYLMKNGHDIIPNPFNTRSYSELPITLDYFNMLADCSSDYDLLIFDSQDWSHTDAIYGMNVCCSALPCSINSFTADIDTSTCTGEIVMANFDIDAENFGLNGYTVSDNYGGSQFYLNSYVKQYILLADCVSDYTLTLTDVDDPTCSASYQIGSACCPCVVDNLSYSAGPCVNDEFDLELNFNVSGSCLFSDFELQIEGVSYPLTFVGNTFLVSGINAVGEPLDALLCSTAAPFDCFPFTININPCFIPASPCHIDSVVVDWSNCGPDGEGDLYLTPVGNSLGSAGFTASINGDTYASNGATLVIDDLLVQMDSLTYTICSNNDPACCYTETIASFCYTTLDCSVDIVSTDWDLFGDTCLLYVFVDTMLTGPVSITIDGGTYPYTLSTFGTVGIFYTFANLNIPSDSLLIEVCSIADSTCCDQYTSLNHCATLVPCEITGVSIEWNNCDSTGRGDLSLTPNGINVGNQGFTAIINGASFTSNGATLEVNNLYAPMDSVTYTICSNEDTTCCYSNRIENTCYSVLDCSVSIVSTDWDIFLDSCLLYVIVDTIHTGPVSITINGDTYNSSISGGHLGSVFYTFVDLDINTDSLQIEVCSTLDTLCCDQYTSWNPCYTPIPCSVSQFTATPDIFACQGDTIPIAFDFLGVNFALNGYRVIANGIDTFEFTLNDTMILHLLVDCNMNTSLTIQDMDDAFCSSVLDLGVLCCAGASTCTIDSTVVNAVINQQGTLDLNVLPYISGNCSASYFVSVQGDQFGPFNYSEGMISIVDLNYDSEEIEVQICDSQFSEICQSQMIENKLITSINQEDFAIKLKYIPAHNQISIQHSMSKLEVMIYNLNGFVIFNKTTDNQKDVFDLPLSTPNGVYIVIAKGGSMFTSQKIIVLK